MNLNVESKILSLVTDATILRIEENSRTFNVIVLFTLKEKELAKIKNYLIKRQMILIREFKTIGI